MPLPFDAVGALVRLPDDVLSRPTGLGDGRTAPTQFVLYDLLRHEQALAAKPPTSERSETRRILDIAQMAYCDLVGLLGGRADELLDSARDGEWTLRDLLRHGIAVELRYAAQAEYAATRREDEPLAIPVERLPGDRLSPPEPDFADSRTGGSRRLLELLGEARARTDKRLDAISDTALTRPSLWGTFEMSVRMRLHQIAAHLSEVIVQSEKMLGAAAAGTEARRVLRRCSAMRGLHERWSDADARAELDTRYRRLAGS